MSCDLAKQIEAFLLENRRWVSGDELAEKFGTNKRAFRALEDRPGLCSEFAISGNKGFKHIRWATEEEFTRSYRRARSHGIAELVGARRRKRYRERLLTPTPAPIHERATGQAVMAI